MPPAAFEQTFTVAVCAGTSDFSDDCLKRGELEATEKLVEFYAGQYARKIVNGTLTLTLPDVLSRAEQLRFIATIEKAALSAAVARMQSDVAKLTPFRWETAEEKADKQAAVDADGKKVKQWEQKAKSEADNGSNWSHDWSSNTHKFKEGTAYKQLKSISIGGWGGT
jgi:hypothetical protein